jgi:glycosyltransferase 2 family protein
MRRYGYAVGAFLGVLLPACVAVLIAVGTEEISRVVSVWPLLAALGISALTWWLQGVIYALLARPQLKNLRVGDMFRVDMAGMFVALVSPVRGAELPYKVYLLKRLGLSAGEGSNVVVTRVMLDVAVLTPAALVGLPLYFELPRVQGSNLLMVSLGATATLAAVLLFTRMSVRGRVEGKTSRPGGSGWQARISGFLSDVRRSFATYWRPGHRAILVYAVALTTVYWTLRLSVGPLALMAAGWTGDWLPVVVAQLLLVTLVLPFAPTPGGSGARELGLAALLSGYVPEGQLLGGLIIYTFLSHWLPLIAGALFAGRQLWHGIVRYGGGRKATDRRGYAEA